MSLRRSRGATKLAVTHIWSQSPYDGACLSDCHNHQKRRKAIDRSLNPLTTGHVFQTIPDYASAAEKIVRSQSPYDGACLSDHEAHPTPAVATFESQSPYDGACLSDGPSPSQLDQALSGLNPLTAGRCLQTLKDGMRLVVTISNVSIPLQRGGAFRRDPSYQPRHDG